MFLAPYGIRCVEDEWIQVKLEVFTHKCVDVVVADMTKPLYLQSVAIKAPGGATGRFWRKPIGQLRRDLVRGFIPAGPAIDNTWSS